MSYWIECADVLDWAVNYDGPPFHALLCDPPYELGFMGKNWDKSGIAFKPHTWTALAEHLHPGAFGMAFASARGWHRLAVAIEDAGLRIHPSIFGWCYGSGFPKATRIGERYRNSEGKLKLEEDERFIGHRYGLQAMKPALEPIIVFQKPYIGCPVDCITETGAGALNIDKARISGTWNRSTPWRDDMRGGNYVAGEIRPIPAEPQECHPQGRWPANLVLQHTPECERVGTRRVKGITGGTGKTTQSIGGRGAYGGGDNRGFFNYADEDNLETIDDWRCVPECPVRRLREQSSPNMHGAGSARKAVRKAEGAGMFGIAGGDGHRFGDGGTAARFFFQSDWGYEIVERLALTDPVWYVAKASRKERDAGLDEKCTHPTIKPIKLTRWLATLLLPSPEYTPRRILVPFCGVMSEGIGAGLAGWEEIVGIDNDEDYCKVGDARMKYWMASPEQIGLKL